jgi:hypothetical protein
MGIELNDFEKLVCEVFLEGKKKSTKKKKNNRNEFFVL